MRVMFMLDLGAERKFFETMDLNSKNMLLIQVAKAPQELGTKQVNNSAYYPMGNCHTEGFHNFPRIWHHVT